VAGSSATWIAEHTELIVSRLRKSPVVVVLEPEAQPGPGGEVRHLSGNYVDGWPSVERTADLAVHVHAKFWQVALDGAEPSIDYPRLIAMLRRRSYAGWISFEYEAAEDEATGIPRALAYLRRVLDS
jgi:hypothetical protein